MNHQNSSIDSVSRLDEVAHILLEGIKRSIKREGAINRDNSLDSSSVPSIHGENKNRGF